MKDFKVKKTLTLPASDIQWYEVAYPEFELSACMTMLLHAFRDEHEILKATPVNVAQIAAKTVKEEIDEGLIEGVRAPAQE